MTTGHHVQRAKTAPRDHRGRVIDLGVLAPLIERIVSRWRPDQIWLFGSRARGDADAASDWDLFAVVPDDTSEAEWDPSVAWRMRTESGVRADVIPCHASDFREDASTPNTLCYEVARTGVVIYER